MALFQLKFSRDGGEVLCAASNQRVYAFDLETGQCTLDVSERQQFEIEREKESEREEREREKERERRSRKRGS